MKREEIEKKVLRIAVEDKDLGTLEFAYNELLDLISEIVDKECEKRVEDVKDTQRRMIITNEANRSGKAFEVFRACVIKAQQGKLVQYIDKEGAVLILNNERLERIKNKAIEEEGK